MHSIKLYIYYIHSNPQKDRRVTFESNIVMKITCTYIYIHIPIIIAAKCLLSWRSQVDCPADGCGFCQGPKGPLRGLWSDFPCHCWLIVCWWASCLLLCWFPVFFWGVNFQFFLWGSPLFSSVAVRKAPRRDILSRCHQNWCHIRCLGGRLRGS